MDELAVTVIGWIITIAIASGGWFFAWRQAKAIREDKTAAEARASLQKKLDRVEAHLDAYAELIGLHRFYASGGQKIAKDELGQFKLDELGNPVIEKWMNDPEPRFQRAFQEMREADIQSGIAQQIIKIRLSDGEISDILYQIDPSGTLNRKKAQLYYRTVDAIEHARGSDDIMSLLKRIDEADRERRELRSIVVSYGLSSTPATAEALSNR